MASLLADAGRLRAARGALRRSAPLLTRLGAFVAFALFALAPPSGVVGFDGGRFGATMLNTCVAITEKQVRSFFPNTQLGRA